MKLSAQFNYNQVDHQKDNTVQLLVTVEAPKIDWIAERRQVCIIPALDTSGSMTGYKFDYAKQACKKLFEQLKTGDYTGLITFDTSARVVVPPQEVTADFKALLLKKLDETRVGGDTNFSEAIDKAFQALTDVDLPPSILHRAIFFTDGQPTRGITDHAALKELVSKKDAHSMSFFGYGAGTACDQDLLTELSQRTRGNYAFVQQPDEALAAFGRELGGLLSTYASDLRLILEPRNGHTIDRVVTLLPPDKQIGSKDDVTEMIVELGDILAEESRHVVFECTLKHQDKALPRDFNIVNVRATCLRIMQEGGKSTDEATSSAKVRFVQPDEAQTVPTPEVDKIVALHQFALAQDEAEKSALRGNYSQAQGILSAFGAQAASRGYVHLEKTSGKLGGMMSNSLNYNANQGYRVSMKRGLIRSAGVSNFDAGAVVDLSEVDDSSMSTTAQDAYSELFQSNPVAPPTVAPLPPAPVIESQNWHLNPNVAGPLHVSTTANGPGVGTKPTKKKTTPKG